MNSYHTVNNYCYFVFYLLTFITITMCFSLKMALRLTNHMTSAISLQQHHINHEIVLYYLSHTILYYYNVVE